MRKVCIYCFILSTNTEKKMVKNGIFTILFCVKEGSIYPGYSFIHINMHSLSFSLTSLKGKYTPAFIVQTHQLPNHENGVQFVSKIRFPHYTILSHNLGVCEFCIRHQVINQTHIHTNTSYYKCRSRNALNFGGLQCCFVLWECT